MTFPLPLFSLRDMVCIHDIDSDCLHEMKAHNMSDRILYHENSMFLSTIHDVLKNSTIEYEVLLHKCAVDILNDKLCHYNDTVRPFMTHNKPEKVYSDMQMLTFGPVSDVYFQFTVQLLFMIKKIGFIFKISSYFFDRKCIFSCEMERSTSQDSDSFLETARKIKLTSQNIYRQ